MPTLQLQPPAPPFVAKLMFAMPQVRGRLKQMQADFESATSAADAVAAASEAAFAAKEREAQVRPWPLYFFRCRARPRQCCAICRYDGWCDCRPRTG